ncbi:MAG: hydroxyethylthiazole kinase [Firmicutes bacterium]|nr:hydroxyethylthiazole kinase [Bacillota bacterium]
MKYIENIRKISPLVHSITNYVTVNDVANVLLACGASPIMADDEGEVEDITSICSSLYINIGTLNTRTIASMIKAGKKSNALGHITVLDPVGAGASALRTQTAQKLISEIKFDVIRANASEISALCGEDISSRGVDASEADTIDGEKAMYAADKLDSVIAVTGKTDIVASKDHYFEIYNGRKEMKSITGTGCQLSALTAAFVAANREDTLSACAAAVTAMGVAGEIGFNNLLEGEGNSSYRNRIIDAIYNMTDTVLEKYGRSKFV